MKSKSSFKTKFKKVALSIAVALFSTTAIFFGVYGAQIKNDVTETKVAVADFSVDDNGDSLPSGAVAISSREDLLAFLCGTTYWGGSDSAKSATYAYLTQDIDFYYHSVSGSAYPTSDVAFAQGKTLDGRGYKVKIKYGDNGNINGDAVTFLGRSNGYTCNIGTLVNLEGTQVGKTTSSSDGVSTNLTITGGFLARNDGIIKNVNFVAEGSINAQFTNNNKNTCGVYGGIVGLNRGTISNCSFTIPEGKYISIWKEPGSLRWFDYNMINLGGFAGISCGTIENSSLNLHGSLEGFSVGWGKTTATGSQYFSNIAVGGFIGAAYGGTVKNVSITGNGNLYGRSMWTQTKGYIIGTAAGATSSVYVNSGRTQSGYASTMYKGNTGDVTVNGVFVYNASFNTSSTMHSQAYKNYSNYYSQSRWNFTDSEWRNDSGTEDYTNPVSLIGDWSVDLSSIQNVYFYGTSSDTQGSANTYYSRLRRITNGSVSEGKVHDIVINNLSNSNVSFKFSGTGILRVTIDTGMNGTFNEIVWDASTEGVSGVLTYGMVNTGLQNAYSWTSNFKKQVSANRSQYILDLLVSESVKNGANHTTTFTGGTMGGTCTIGDISNVYDGNVHPINTVTLGSGAIVSKNDANFAGVLTGEASPIDVGTYTYTLTNGSAGYVYANTSLKRLHNYIQTSSATSTITAKSASMTISGNTGLVYNGAKQEPTVTLSGILSRDTLVVTKTYTKDGVSVDPIDAGTYVMKVTITGSGVKNYSFNGFTKVSDTEIYTTSEFNIVKKDLTVSLSDYSNFSYDGTQKAVTLNLQGLIGSYSYSVVYSGDSTKPIHVGEYTANIQITSDDFDSDNYNLPTGFERVQGNNKVLSSTINFSISPKILTLTYSNTSGHIYSGETQEISVQFNETIVSGDEISAEIVYEVSDVEGNNATLKDGLPYNAGTYSAITILVGESNILSDYEINATPISFEISKKTLNIFVNASDVTYDGEPHDFISSISRTELVEADNSHDITYYVVNSDEEEISQSVDAGLYAIYAKVDGDIDADEALDNNYDIVYVKNTYNILRAEVNLDNLVFENASFMYDGNLHTISVSGTPMEGVKEEFVYSGGEDGANGRTNAGTSTISATYSVASANYKFVVDGNESDTKTITAILTVNKKHALVSDIIINDETITYDGEDHTITPTSLPEGVYLTQYFPDASYKNAGVYQFHVFFSVYDNYIFELADGSVSESPQNKLMTLTIKKAVVTLDDVIFENVVIDAYDGEAHSIAYSLTEGSDLATYVRLEGYTGGEDGSNSRTNAGTSEITATFGLVDGANYTFKNESDEEVATLTKTATITIKKAVVTLDDIIFNDINIDEYDENAHSVAYSLADQSSLMNYVTFVGYTGGEEGSNFRTSAGTSEITATFGLVDGSNYTFKNELDEEVATLTKTATITIGKAIITLDDVIFNDVVIDEYDGLEHLITYSLVENSELENKCVIFVGYTGGEDGYNSRTNAGTSAVTVNFKLKSNNYTFKNELGEAVSTASKTANITINKGIITLNDVIFENVVIDEYDGEAHSVTYSLITGSSLMNYVTFVGYTGGEDGSNSRTNAGTSEITATFGLVDGNNYTFKNESGEAVSTASKTANVIIGRKQVNINNITFSSAEKEYDGEPLAIVYAGDLVEGVTFVGYTDGEGETNSRTNAGVSEITATFGVLDNYCFGKDESGAYILEATKTATITISRATPVFNIPEEVEAKINEGFPYTNSDQLETLKTEINKITTTSDAEIVVEWPSQFLSSGDYILDLSTAQTNNYEASEKTIKVKIVGTDPLLMAELNEDIDLIYIGQTIDEVRTNNFTKFSAIDSVTRETISGQYSVSWSNEDGSASASAPQVGDAKAYVKVLFTPRFSDYNPVYEVFEWNVDKLVINVKYNHSDYEDLSDVVINYNRALDPTSDIFNVSEIGYKLEWREEGSSEKYDFATKVITDKTLVAYWSFDQNYIKNTRVDISANEAQVIYGNSITLTANIINSLENVSYEYVWYKDNSCFENSLNTWTVNDVLDSGNYKVDLIITSDITNATTTVSDVTGLDVVIKPAVIELTGIVMSDRNLTYNGDFQSIEYTGTLSEFVEFIGYTGGQNSLGNGIKDVSASGIIEAKFKIKDDDTNHSFGEDSEGNAIREISKTANLTIEPKEIAVIGKYIGLSAGESFVYDGNEHSVEAEIATENSGIIGDDQVSIISYENDSAINAGNYTTEVVFDNSNYTASFEWSINKQQIEITGLTFKDKAVWYRNDVVNTNEYTGSLSEFIEFVNYTGGENGSNGRVSVGESVIYANFKIKDVYSNNYEFVGGSQESSINSKLVVVDLSIVVNTSLVDNTYDGINSIELSASLTAGDVDLSGYTWIAYEVYWKKAGSIVTDDHGNAVNALTYDIVLKEVADSDTYSLRGILSSDGQITPIGIYDTVEKNHLVEIEASEAVKVTAEETRLKFDYNGQTIKDYLEKNLSEIFKVNENSYNLTLNDFERSYSDESSKNVGDYNVSVTFSRKNFKNSVINLEVEISSKEIIINYENSTGKFEDDIEIIDIIPYGETVPNYKNIFTSAQGLVSSDDITVEYYKHKTEKGIAPASADVDLDTWTQVTEISEAGKYMVLVYTNNRNYDLTTKKYYVYITKEEVVIDDSKVEIEYSGNEYIPNVVKDQEGNTLSARYTIYKYEDGLQSDVVDKIVDAGLYRINVEFLETDDFFGQTKNFFVNIKPKQVDVIWENLENPVEHGAFVVKAYYVDVNDNKVYLPIKGVDVTNFRPEKYTLSVESVDKNYEFTEASAQREVTIQSTMLWWTLIIYGISLILAVWITVEGITVFGFKLSKGINDQKQLEKEKKLEQKAREKRANRNYKRYYKDYMSDKKFQEAYANNPEKYKKIFEKRLQKALKEEDKKLVQRVNSDYEIFKKQDSNDRKILLLIHNNPEKYLKKEQENERKALVREIRVQKLRLEAKKKQLAKEEKLKKILAEKQAKFEQKELVRVQRENQKKLDQEKRQQELNVAQERRETERRIRIEKQKEEERRKADEKRAIAEQKAEVERLAREKKEKELLAKREQEKYVAEMKSKERAKKEAEKQTILEQKRTQELKKSEEKQRAEERREIERAKKAEIKRKNDEIRRKKIEQKLIERKAQEEKLIADRIAVEEKRKAEMKAREEQRLLAQKEEKELRAKEERRLTQEKARKAQLEAERKEAKRKELEAKKSIAGTKRAERLAKIEMERKMAETARAEKLAKEEQIRKANIAKELNKILDEQKQNKKLLQEELENLDKIEENNNISTLNALDQLVKDGRVDSPESKKTADELIKRQKQLKIDLDSKRQKLQENAKKKEEKLLSRIDKIVGKDSIGDFMNK